MLAFRNTRKLRRSNVNFRNIILKKFSNLRKKNTTYL